MDLPEITNLIPSLSENLEKITELRNVLEDTSFEVEKWLSKINESFEGLENTEQRISSYQGLFRKTSTRNIEELVSYIGEIKDELSKIKILDEKLRGLTSSLPVTVDALIMSSAKLTNAREQAAEKIAVEVANEFEELAMKGASISVKFLPVRSGFVLEHFDSLDEASRDIWADSCEKTLGISSLGSERPVIHLSSNPGEEAKPLEKIASGGEISRIMLSLKRVLASGADACVLVFDEIDSGISGEVANKVGSKLKSLSKSFQIICISHLAQVASYGDRHFKVSKTQLDDRTFTSINALTDVQSTEELARLVSGEGITKASRDHARILKDKAKNI
jgi:DNA repair protein RecN (Recombination protein N)